MNGGAKDPGIQDGTEMVPRWVQGGPSNDPGWIEDGTEIVPR